MYIIAGLGNPGREYAHTRHNTGFDALDVLAERAGISVAARKFKGLTGSGYIEGAKVLLVKPQTYMNLSGECLRDICGYYQEDPETRLIVLYDDISLPPGQLRVRGKGSAGGHNGIRNIIAELGTQTFLRVRIGVGEKPEHYDLVDYVLGHPQGEERKRIQEALSEAADATAMLVKEPLSAVMNRFNTKKDTNT